MRLLGCQVLLGMLRPGRDAPEPQPAQQAAHRALGHAHAELGLQNPGQVHPAPAHHAVLGHVRSLAHQLGQPLRLPGVQQRLATAAPAINQAVHATLVVAMHPVAQRLPVHAGRLRRSGPRLAVQDQGQRQHAARRCAILAA